MLVPACERDGAVPRQKGVEVQLLQHEHGCQRGLQIAVVNGLQQDLTGPEHRVACEQRRLLAARHEVGTMPETVSGSGQKVQAETPDLARRAVLQRVSYWARPQ